jgi:hypothetical protein
MVEDSSPLELNSLLEIMKKTPQPFKSIAFFQRIEVEVQKSSRQAFIFHEFMCSNWEVLKTWMNQDKTTLTNRTLVKIISGVISWAISDCETPEEAKTIIDPIKSKKKQSTERHRPPLQNITNQ